MSLIRSNNKKDKLAHLRQLNGNSKTLCGKNADYSKSVKNCELCDKCLNIFDVENR
jgi:hypothetical protein